MIFIWSRHERRERMFSKKQEEGLGTGQVETFIGPGSKFQGTIDATGTLRIDGSYEGEINTQGNLIVGENGTITADIHANNVTLAGYLKGNICGSGTVEIKPKGKLYGNIDVKHVIIHEGAIFEGNCKMSEEEQKKEDEKHTKKAKAAKNS